MARRCCARCSASTALSKCRCVAKPWLTPPPGIANVAADSTQRVDAAEDLRAVLIFVEPPAEQDRRRLSRGIAARERTHRVRGKFALRAKLFKRCTDRGDADKLQSRECAARWRPYPLDLPPARPLPSPWRVRHRSRPAAERVRRKTMADSDRTGSIRTILPPRFAHLLQERHHVQIGGKRIAAPQQHEAAVEYVHGVVAEACAEVERLPRARRAAAQRAARGGDAAEQIPEAAAQQFGRAPGARYADNA